MSDGSGTRCVEFARWSDRDGCWLKTSQGCCQLMLDGSLEAYCETWPKSGMWANGSACRRQTWERTTSATGCSSSHDYPTPSAQRFHSNKGGSDSSDPRGWSREGKERLTLDGMAKVGMWPTPQSFDANDVPDGNRSARVSKGGCRNLSQEIGGMLNPTWVEWIQGFPLGWTDLDVSATASCRPSLNSSDA